MRSLVALLAAGLAAVLTVPLVPAAGSAGDAGSAGSAGAAGPVRAGDAPPYLDLAGRGAGRTVVLRGTVVGAPRVVLQRAACPRECTWRPVAGLRVRDNVVSRTLVARPGRTWYRLRAARRSSWPVVVDRRDGVTVRDLVAPKPSSTVEPPELRRAEGAIAWTSLRRCTVAGRPLVSSGRVTNPLRAARDVVVVISWTNATGDVLARDTAVLVDVPPGATRRWRAESVAPRGGAVTQCVLTVTAGRLPG